jgi:phosphoribosyl 1,2-cyclic phosphodiesterase
MSLFIASLNSGSNGNCYYIGNQDEAILVDAGISCRETERRMKRLHLPINRVRAIFISHEHVDHIKGVETLAHKYQLPVYITGETLSGSGLALKKQFVFTFEKFKPVKVGGLTVLPFPKFHDALNPHSFFISFNKVHVGVFTDLGVACEDVKKYFRQCHAAFLESNYDEHMLMTGSYPIHLKNRIRNGQGHLSNRQALELFIQHKPAFMSHLLLSHLSQNNNSPQLVYDLFKKNAGLTEIIIASREKETPVYHIEGRMYAPHFSKRIVNKEKPVQLSLFNH